ncbi:hypothetical protein C3Y94_025880 [Rhizobium ruizarguesonis]|uniref:hypothetical protein n=1 Tax=Rhizobium ruizarguesonis TaxID=2081791 RepID=UPI00163A8AB0|nr:hypothetical protein [Rhizobium ruizarguesonis]MBC2806584.1 hypothetical protein [Rhizobium ruizarguesonis]
MHVTSTGAVFGQVDPGLLAETRQQQSLFNTDMLKYRVRDSRPQIAISFTTKTSMPAVFLAAGTYPGLANVEVHSPIFVTVYVPYRSADDVKTMRVHFRDLWQMTRTL